MPSQKAGVSSVTGDGITGPDEPVVGSSILDLVGTAMYDNPLALYREYLQNAADAATTLERAVEAHVHVKIDRIGGKVIIRDNGPGLSRRMAIRSLVPIARSAKEGGVYRGFRGIGRLSGLAFGESVIFRTRARGDNTVTCVRWDGGKLRRGIRSDQTADDAVLASVDITSVSGSAYPDQFFEVEVSGVARYAAGLVLNREAVRNYIGQVCPVPIHPVFPFSGYIESILSDVGQGVLLHVFLDNESVFITRPHGQSADGARVSDTAFHELEPVTIPTIDGHKRAATGWVAHWSYRGALPKDSGIRGIRARVGNIQVGDENVFAHLFSEDRFNKWCVGEIHVLDRDIVPNGRRDYFEAGPQLRNLENHLGPVFRNIVARCRKASAQRNRVVKTRAALAQLDIAYRVASSGWLFPEDIEQVIEHALQVIDKARSDVEKGNNNDRFLVQLDRVKEKLGAVSNRRYSVLSGDTSGVEGNAYRRVFGAMLRTSWTAVS